MATSHTGGSPSGPHSLHLHRGHAVKVGDHTIYAGGFQNLRPEDFTALAPDVLIPLAGICPAPPGFPAEIFELTLQDFGGVPPDWDECVDRVIEMLEEGKKVLAFCYAGHGRTGTLLASLVSVLEMKVRDPITAVRERYCSHAVETVLQGEAVFRLRGQPLPGYWRRRLIKPKPQPAKARRTS